MASRPSSSNLTLYANWAENTANLPSTGATNKIAPPSSHTTTGMDYNEPLTAEEFNYQLNLISKWIKHLDTPVTNPNVTIYASPAATTSAQGYTSVTVSLTSGISGDTYTFPTGTITKLANQANGTASGGTAWSAGNNNPGWLSGTVIASSTWYNIYAIKTTSQTLDVCFTSISTTASQVISSLTAAVAANAVWIGCFYRLNCDFGGTAGQVFDAIQNTHVTFVYPFFQFNGIPYPVPFSFPAYLYYYPTYSSVQEVNTSLPLLNLSSTVTNGVSLKLEFNMGMFIQANYDATAGDARDNLAGIITSSLTTTSTATDNFNMDSWSLSQNEWQIYAGSPSILDVLTETSSPTMRILTGQSLRVVHRFETEGSLYINTQSWRILDYDNAVRGFLV